MENSLLAKLSPEISNRIYDLVLIPIEIEIRICTKTVGPDVPLRNDRVSHISPERYSVDHDYHIVFTDNMFLMKRCNIPLAQTCKQIYAETKGYRYAALSYHAIRIHLPDLVSPLPDLHIHSKLPEARKLELYRTAWPAKMLDWLKRLLAGDKLHSILLDLGYYPTPSPESRILTAERVSGLKSIIADIDRLLGKEHTTNVFLSITIAFDEAGNDGTSPALQLPIFSHDSSMTLRALSAEMGTMRQSMERKRKADDPAGLTISEQIHDCQKLLCKFLLEMTEPKQGRRRR